jgi:hypothetical protein
MYNMGAWLADCSFIAGNLPFSISFFALNSVLSFKFRGLVLNLEPQHGHDNPSQFKKVSHI